MDFDAGLLLFIFIFFVLPLIQRALGRAKQAPPGGRPGQRGPGVPPGPTGRRARVPDSSHAGTLDRPDVDQPPTGAEPERTQPQRAADLIPDDLWEILTGERRSPASSPRRPAPMPQPELEAEPHEWGTNAEEWQPEDTGVRVPETYDDEAYDEEQVYQRPASPEHHRHEEAARTSAPAPTRKPAPITASENVSHLPTADAPPYSITHPTPLGRVGLRGSDSRRRGVPQALSNRSELKRAFVLREVLGPPKALE